MISFDVVSLFTSIPLDTAKQITNDLLTNAIAHGKPKQHYTKTTYFTSLTYAFTLNSLQNNYYRQISGTPMGSPLSSFLAEAVMQDLEKRSVTNNTNIRTWDRYIDDVLATVKKDKTEDILHTINNTTSNIKFTKEEGTKQPTCQPRTQGLLGSKVQNKEGPGKLWSHLDIFVTWPFLVHVFPGGGEVVS